MNRYHDSQGAPYRQKNCNGCFYVFISDCEGPPSTRMYLVTVSLFFIHFTHLRWNEKISFRLIRNVFMFKCKTMYAKYSSMKLRLKTSFIAERNSSWNRDVTKVLRLYMEWLTKKIDENPVNHNQNVSEARRKRSRGSKKKSGWKKCGRPVINDGK